MGVHDCDSDGQQVASSIFGERSSRGLTIHMLVACVENHSGRRSKAGIGCTREAYTVYSEIMRRRQCDEFNRGNLPAGGGP